MTDREKLKLAARACDHTIADEYVFEGDVRLPPIGQEHIRDSFYWNPLTDHADSDRMACKLRIETRFMANRAESSFHGSWTAYITHDNTDEDVCRAVREARLLVAVEIGRLK